MTAARGAATNTAKMLPLTLEAVPVGGHSGESRHQEGETVAKEIPGVRVTEESAVNPPGAGAKSAVRRYPDRQKDRMVVRNVWGRRGRCRTSQDVTSGKREEDT